MLFFVLNRIVFISYHLGELNGLDIAEIISSFYYAIYLDVSTACYLLVFPFFFVFFQSLFLSNFFLQVNRFYSFLMIVTVSVLVSSELGVYDEWGTKLNAKALMYLEHPSEIFRSATTGVLVSGILFIVLQSVLGIYFYNRFIWKPPSGHKKSKWSSVSFFILAPAFIFLGIRGGWQPIPIHQSDVYFSKSNFLNLATVNSSWNMMQSIFQNMRNLNKNPYSFYTAEESKKEFADIHRVQKDSTVFILTEPRPNVVVFILEGWTADVIESLGGEKEVAPEFEKLVSEGLLFTNCFSTGERSEQGIAAILSGFPALPSSSIIGQPSKYPRMSGLNPKLISAGYSTSFMFGGQLNYGNIKGFIFFSRFDKIVEGSDFPGNIVQQRLGVPDEFLFERNLNEMNEEKEPFFSVMYTLSSHAPYDVPMEEVISKGGEHREYLNSVYYTDRSIGDYFRKAREQKWYKNTLFIIIADHSHPAPAKRDFYEPAYKKIPLLLYGDVLKDEYKGAKMEKIVSQIDIPATLLAQLSINHEEFRWSKNFFNPYAPEFAYYTFFTDGFGWIEKNNFVVYRNDTKEIYLSSSEEDREKQILVKKGKAYIQSVYQEYLDF